jgi:hypothetical protein
MSCCNNIEKLKINYKNWKHHHQGVCLFKLIRRLNSSHSNTCHLSYLVYNMAVSSYNTDVVTTVNI